ncbi:MAG: hypothetical protein AAF611_14725 [Bacteroidota bacterium]
MKKQNFKKGLALSKKKVSNLNKIEINGGAAASGNFACTRSLIGKCATQATYTYCAGCNSWYC